VDTAVSAGMPPHRVSRAELNAGIAKEAINSLQSSASSMVFDTKEGRSLMDIFLVCRGPL
jgi:hypothetical protein